MSNDYQEPKRKSKRQKKSCWGTTAYLMAGLGICGCFGIVALIILGPVIGNIFGGTRIIYVEEAVALDVQAVNVAYQLPLVPAQGGVFSNSMAFQVDSQQMTVNIVDNSAEVSQNLQISNMGETAIEGVFIVPLPDEAALTNIAVQVDGQSVTTRPYNTSEGRERLQTLAYEYEDFALLAFVDKPFVEIPVFPLTGSKNISVQYQHELGTVNGLLELDIPLSFPVSMNRPVGEFNLSIDASNALPIRNVYPATLNLDMNQDNPNRLRASTTMQDTITPQNLAFYYAASDAGFVANVLTYRENNEEDGYFLLMIEPSAGGENQVVAQDVMLVLDNSGSMTGIKWQQAQAAASFVLDNLNPQDRFFVTIFSSSSSFFANSLSPVSEAEAASAWVNNRAVEGGTNINDALLDTLRYVDAERPTTLIFMTDGQATEGVTDNQSILANLRQAVPANVRIFVFGVGDGVNTSLLDGIAQEFNGQTAYVRESETIDAEISSLYQRISSPILTNISLDFGDVVAGDFVPSSSLPDLYAGQQMILAGRYRGGGDTISVQLTGTSASEAQTYQFDNLSFQNERGGRSFVMQLWANRRVGEMLNQVRLGNQDPELINSITAYSLRYGIITPYTEFLLEQDNVLSAAGLVDANTQMLANASLLQQNQTGAAAVDAADMLNNLSASYNVVSTPSYRSGSIYSGLIFSGYYSEQRITITATPLAPISQNGVLISIYKDKVLQQTQYVLSLNPDGFAQAMASLPDTVILNGAEELPLLISRLLNQYGIERGIEIYNQAFGAYLPLVPSEEALLNDGYRIAPAPIRFSPSLQIIHEKVFILQDGSYVDTRYQPDSMSATRIQLGSAEYVSLIESQPALLPYLAAGVPLIIVWEGNAYEIYSE